MFADQALHCECGYEVRASDEAARVDEVRRHASETHGVDLSADAALDSSAALRLVPSNEQRSEVRAEPVESRRAAENDRIRRGVDR
jgi:predicted small metal-binding protein